MTDIANATGDAITPASPSCDSYGRTDGRTNEDVTYPPLKSSTSVPRTRIIDDDELATAWRRSATSAEPADIREALGGWLDDWDASMQRQPVIRTGTREPLCWHLRSIVKRRDNWQCRWCSMDGGHAELHLDHIKPWSAGGPHDTRNLQVLCANCNEIKGNRLDPAGEIQAAGIVIECLRCGDFDSPPRGELVWCFTCQTFSHHRPAWVDLAQDFLAQHCDKILRPKPWNKEVATYERHKLVDEWQAWAPDAARNYEQRLRDSAKELAIEWREARGSRRGLPEGNG